MSVFHRIPCVCADGCAPGCHGGQVFLAEFPERLTAWTCPHCGGSKMRPATEQERDHWRYEMESQRWRHGVSEEGGTK